MLKGLDNVDWEKLSGTSEKEYTDVPHLIQSLTSDDPQVRSDTFDYLIDIIGHQGTVCEITSYVIPFLVELLASNSVVEKVNILLFLYTICWVHREYDQDHRNTPYKECGATPA